MNRAWKAAAIAGACVVIAGGATACSSSSSSSSSASPSASSSPSVVTSTYSDNGVTFQYPQEWEERQQNSGASTGTQLWTQSFGPSTSTSNLAIVSAYSVNIDITEENIASTQGEIETTIANLAKQANGTVTSPVKIESTAGLPGFTADVQVKTQSGTTVDSTLWLFFQGKTEYFINCQAVPEAVTEMMAGCQVIRDTFKPTP